MSDNNTRQIKYDVFISFRGEIHRRFLSHLVDTFKSKKINVFVDDILERGDKIWSSLVGVIEGSSISLIIFSPNYASSRWCLEELVKILDCKEKYGQIVIPVFYNVEPTHVRHQSSHKYKNAFAKHERKYNSKVQFWRDALNKSTNLSGGIESSKFRNDAELLDEIVNLVQIVLTRLDKPLCSNSKGFVGSNSKELVGIDGNIAKVESLIRTEPKDTHLFVKEISMSDNDTLQTKYDVFVSFRGKDTCHGILSHLANAFETKKINAFVDGKLKRSDQIWKSLVRAIEGSSISLIIFSPDYASSRWCLDELVTIQECREKNGQTVIPVFYHVEPANVRHQSGSYKNAFAGHEIEYKTKVKIWRHALNVSTDLSGFESSNFQNDAELVKEIVNVVLERLPKASVNSKNLVGIEEKIAYVESLINKQPKDTRLIGIWGMGGIGKTTLAEQVFDKLRTNYEGSYFLDNVREQSSKRETKSLKKEIFSRLLGYDVEIDTPNLLPEDICRAISCMKVLIVLDDVYDLDHIEKFLGNLDNFGSGSRIIVTTRDEQVLKANKADEKYQLREFSPKEALELFHLDAFTQSDHSNEYDELSKRVVNYAKGNPLVLKLLARHLCGNKKEAWEGVLEKLKKMPPREVFSVLKVSFDGLEHKEQQIFLDLACFFLRLHEAVNVDGMKSFWKDIGESDDTVVADLERLEDKALITISKDKVVSIHDCLQEMAWEIVRQESSIPGCRSRLWDSNDIYSVSENDKGIEVIRSIRMFQLPNKKFSLHIFSKMRRLQFLEIHHPWFLFLESLSNQLNILDKEGLVFLPNELRFLSWVACPIESLPDSFSAEKLVILKLQFSRVEKLWDEVKNLVNLEEVDLSYSVELKELPDLSKATNLEVLLVDYCSKLTSVHPSVFSLEKLDKLDLSGCKSLTALVSHSQVCNLSYLNLDYCENLKEFSLISKNMKELGLKGTKVKALAPSFGHQNKLKTLHLSGTDIERLPSSFNNLTQLPHLDVYCCKKLHTIAELPLFLESLDANGCSSLQSIPKLPQSLKTLDVRGCYALQSLPELPQSLKTLDVKHCSSLHSLPELPPYLETLNAGCCSSLQSIPKLRLSLKTLDVKGCYPLQSLPELPQSLKTLDVKHCFSLHSLPELPPYLEILNAEYCHSLQTIPMLPQYLNTLDVQFCSKLDSLPELPPDLEIRNKKQ